MRKRRNLLRNNHHTKNRVLEVAKADTIRSYIWKSQCSFSVFWFLFSTNWKQKAHEAWSVWPKWHHPLSWPYQIQLAVAMWWGLCVNIVILTFTRHLIRYFNQTHLLMLLITSNHVIEALIRSVCVCLDTKSTMFNYISRKWWLP